MRAACSINDYYVMSVCSGVKSIEYGVVGEVLIWTLRYIMIELYTNELHMRWIRVISRMLRVMVPIAVAHELQEGYSQPSRMQQLIKAAENAYLSDISSARSVGEMPTQQANDFCLMPSRASLVNTTTIYHEPMIPIEYPMEPSIENRTSHCSSNADIG